MNIATVLKQRWRLVAAVLVVALVLGVGIWWLNRPRIIDVAPPLESPSASIDPTPTTPVPSPSVSTPPSLTPSATTSTASTSAAVAPASLADCQPVTADGFVPNRFTMTRPVADERILSLGLDPDGAIAAPPKNQPRTASWWNQGPRAGSDKGKVVMSIHTYRTGKALGNEMYADDKSTLRPGDLIKLHGPDGKVACYEFVESKKVWVKDYDPDSDVMVDFEGKPMLTIVICWDFKASTEEWRSRILFYAKPVSA